MRGRIPNSMLEQAKKAAIQRATIIGQCECRLDSHNHSFASCPRKLKVRFYPHWKLEHPHLADANKRVLPK